MNDDALPPLSPRGVDRRREILAVALGAARRKRIRRRAAGAALAAALCLAAAGLLTHAGRDGLPIPQQARAPHAGPPPVEAATPVPVLLGRSNREVVVRRIETQRGLADALAIRPAEGAWERIEDAELLRRLADAGRPAGLARVNGRVEILFRGRGGHDPR